MAQRPRLNIQAPPRIVESLAAATEYLWSLYRGVVLEPNTLGDQATLEGTATQVEIELEIDQKATDYEVLIQVVGRTGAPAADSDRVLTIAKEAKKFTVTFAAAPGPGNSILFDWLTRR